MDPDVDSSDDDNLGLKPSVTWDFNSQPDANSKFLPQPRFTSNLLKKSNPFHKQICKLTSPLERTNLKKMMESKEIGILTGLQRSPQNNSKPINRNSSSVADNRKKMVQILENIQCECRKDSSSQTSNTTNNIENNKNKHVEDIEYEMLDEMFADPLPSKEVLELFDEPNILNGQNEINSPPKLFKMKTSSPFIGLNRKNINLDQLQRGTNFLAPPLISFTDVKVLNEKENNENLLDTHLDCLMENIELSSFANVNSNTSLKRSFHQMKQKFNRSLSESAIEKKCSLLDDDLFGTDDGDELENQLHEIELIATQTLNKPSSHSKNTIILCDKTDYSINVDNGDNSKVNPKYSEAEVEERRLAALKRLKSRSGPLIHRPNFYPTLNSSFKR